MCFLSFGCSSELGQLSHFFDSLKRCGLALLKKMPKDSQYFNEQQTPPPPGHERLMIDQVHRSIPESVVNKIIGITEKKSDDTFYAMMSVRQCVYLFLFYLLSGASYVDMEALLDIPHSNISRACTLMRSILYRNLKKEIHFFPLKIRKLANSKRTKAEWLKQCSLAVDSIDLPKSLTEKMKSRNRTYRRTRGKSKGDMWRSRKLKNHHHALRYHFCCDFLYRIGYVSSYRPPIEYDSNGIIADQENFEKAIDKEDVILGDDHYRKVRRVIKKVGWIVPKRDSENSWNQKVDVKRNEEQCSARKIIENELAQISNKFLVLSKPWTGSCHHHQQMVWVIAAIHNLIVDSQYPQLRQ